MKPRHVILLAAINLLIAVACGAFGAHGLRSMRSPELLAVWQTAVSYQQVHGLGLFGLAWLLSMSSHPLVKAAILAIQTGVVLFSGSLYLLVLAEARWLGTITPFGGISLLGGWLLVAVAAWRLERT